MSLEHKVAEYIEIGGTAVLMIVYGLIYNYARKHEDRKRREGEPYLNQFKERQVRRKYEDK